MASEEGGTGRPIATASAGALTTSVGAQGGVRPEQGGWGRLATGLSPQAYRMGRLSEWLGGEVTGQGAAWYGA